MRNKNVRRRCWPTAAIALGAVLMFAAVPASGQALQNVRAASPTKGIPFFPMYVARDMGMFRSEGLAVEEIVDFSLLNEVQRAAGSRR
jgi:ABC-type nitrate/sulfonate/bicarbonate transport system substrate-binding protein